ncbi:MAG TPA: ABC transporter substrate-binding protein, partial [bacterium]|nr:ABC transporter substrate-binding protein [bacterium]
DVLETYTLLGKVLGHQAQAARARRRLEARLEAVQKGRAGREPVSVLFVVGHNVGAIEGIYAAGGKSFVGQILRDSGGRNVLEDAAEAFPLVSKEALIREDPEVIVDAMPGDEASEDTLKKARTAWARLPFLRAVRHHRVYFIRNDEMTIPGPTMVDLAEYLSGIFGEAQRDLR